ncbi:MAG TPA: hypothetical protein VLF68_00075, partial [Candidatus Saccharimonadales bacterium]|nr:hypothetical protein [Candidatus Saccharimonadales bacterium]
SPRRIDRPHSRRALLVAGAAALGVAGISTRALIKGYVLGGEDHGLTSLKGQPRNPNALHDTNLVHDITFKQRSDGKTIFRKSPTQDDDSLLPEIELRKKGIDPTQPLRTIDVYGVTYSTNVSAGNRQVKDANGKDLGAYGEWQEIVRIKPGPKPTIERTGVFVPDIYIQDKK